MIQNATSREFETYPSTPENGFRAIETTVAIEATDEADGTYVDLSADLRISDGDAISGLYLSASGYLSDPHLLDEISADLSDLEHFKNMVDAWYDDARSALQEAQAEIGRHILQSEAAEPEPALVG